MKSAVLAAIATCILAYDPQDIPEDLVEFVEKRWSLVPHPNPKKRRSIKFGTDALTFGELREMRAVLDKGAYRKCRRGALRFDRYCHQYGVDDSDIEEGEIPKYADLRDERQVVNSEGEGVVDSEGEPVMEKFCNFNVEDNDGIVDQYYCLGQQCMFEYCLYRRDKWLEDCVDNDGEVDAANWGDVYNFDTMHGDLASNDGTWDNEVCDAYYAIEENIDGY